MANPNIANLTDIRGKTVGQAVTVVTTAIVGNPGSSNKVYKINSLTIANVDGTNAADVTVDVLKSGTTSFKLASTITVPPDATLVVISKDNSIYLEETDSLRCLASVDSRLQAVCSYEEIA
jgi:hypothetical protein